MERPLKYYISIIDRLTDCKNKQFVLYYSSYKKKKGRRYNENRNRRTSKRRKEYFI